MPDGSSSAAPVIRPGPRDRRNFSTLFTSFHGNVRHDEGGKSSLSPDPARRTPPIFVCELARDAVAFLARTATESTTSAAPTRISPAATTALPTLRAPVAVLCARVAAAPTVRFGFESALFPDAATRFAVFFTRVVTLATVLFRAGAARFLAFGLTAVFLGMRFLLGSHSFPQRTRSNRRRATGMKGTACFRPKADAS